MTGSTNNFQHKLQHDKKTEDGNFLFSTHGYALSERKNKNGMYIYTAVNLITGKTKIINRRRQKLSEDHYGEIISKIKTLSEANQNCFLLDRKTDEKTESHSLIKTTNYIFKEILPKYGYALRDKQIQLTEHIIKVIEKRGISLAESGVGTGKTHAYLIAAVLAKRGRLNDSWLRSQSWAGSAFMPIIISTSSIALQEALVADYIPELSRILLECGVIKTPLTAFVRKGKYHYICEERLKCFYKNLNHETKKLLTPFLQNKTLFDLSYADNLSAHIKRRICVKDGCGENCKHYEECRYQNYLKKANAQIVDFQITNHNYFLADRIHRAGSKKSLLPNYQLVIIDEAHKFLDAARTMYGLELTNMELPELAQSLHVFARNKIKSGSDIHKLAKKLYEQSLKLFKQLKDNIPETENKNRRTGIDDKSCHFLLNIKGILNDIAKAITDSDNYSIDKDRYSKLVRLLNQTSELVSAFRKHNNHIYWFENRLEGEIRTQALCAISKDLDFKLFNDLWSEEIPIILTSGTLSASGNFNRIKEKLGLPYLLKNRLSEITISSPFDYRNNTLLYISEKIPFPDKKDKRYITAIADEIEQLVIASHGHAAVLFTSYNVMGQIYAILKKRSLPFPLFRLERGETQTIEHFKKSVNGILLASGSMWEGIDIPGDTLSMLIIVKLPFTTPNPVSSYELSLCGDFETYKTKTIVPDMFIAFLQGSGRLIRKETDTGVIAVIDIRVSLQGEYRCGLLSVLPPYEVTSEVKRVKTFIHDKKSIDYFFNKDGGS